MPIWGAFFLLRLHHSSFRWIDFTRHGEFALYAAAFLAPSVYQILKSFRRNKFPLKGGSVLLALVGILMAAFIYAGTNPQFGPSAGTLPGVDESYLVRVSSILLASAFLFSFMVSLIEMVVSDPDLGVSDDVNQAFLRAAVAMDSPDRTQQSSELLGDGPGPIPTNEELKIKFKVANAEEDLNG